MTMLAVEALQQIRSGRLTLGFGVHHLRGAAVPLLAKAAGYDWLFIDSEHGAISTQEISQLCLAALSTGIAPIVRVCRGAIDEGTRALDNGALGVIIPHVDTPDEARFTARLRRVPGRTDPAPTLRISTPRCATARPSIAASSPGCGSVFRRAWRGCRTRCSHGCPAGRCPASCCGKCAE